MNSTTTLSTSLLPADAPACARAVLRLLAGLRHGCLHAQFPDGSTARFGRDPTPSASIRLSSWNVCAAALRSGDIGFAESYIAGEWTTPDLSALMTLFVRNREALESVVYGSWWGSMLYRLRHWLNRNSRTGSPKNIHAHYDLGNDFYRLWLDDGMAYSSAWFEGDHARPTAEAQQAKMRRALRMAQVQPGAHLLEIGCGWGGLAETAVAEFGAHVTGVTLSREQLDYARERLQRAGLADRTELRLRDYRDIQDGPFDAVVSIEMFEAVGRAYWPGFFEALHRRLKPGGRACIQTITIDDRLFERYTRSTDFIQQYVFPGGCLPSPSAFRAHASQAGLELVDELAFGRDYAETLKRWRERFLSAEARVRQLGFDNRFVRIWEFYLSYCEAAFAAGNTNVFQFTLRRP